MLFIATVQWKFVAFKTPWTTLKLFWFWCPPQRVHEAEFKKNILFIYLKKKKLQFKNSKFTQSIDRRFHQMYIQMDKASGCMQYIHMSMYQSTGLWDRLVDLRIYRRRLLSLKLMFLKTKIKIDNFYEDE